jgi:type I restriction enzyme R subunit
MKNKEAMARIKINKLLEVAGWRFFDDENRRANILLEPKVKIAKEHFNEFGDNFEKVHNGFVDFCLLDDRDKPFIVVEAKRDDLDPLVGKEQARNYARSLNVKYVILTNGDIHYFWNIENGNPQIIVAFPTYESLREKSTLKYDTKSFIDENITEGFIANTMLPNYAEKPEYKNENTRGQFIKKNKLALLRPYQIKAIQSIQKSMTNGNTRFLFEMATGTGKTLTSAAVIKLFLKSSLVKRVLFLVDRIELENQGVNAFRRYLNNDYITYKFKDHPDDWRTADIVVCTAQTLLAGDRYLRIFKPTDFDLIISDEAHRSINGNSRALFEYFLGYKLGLTATPKDYIKNITEKDKSRDPRSWEKRQILDTYKTFGCASGEPTFRYNLNDGVKDGWLVSPYIIDARTNITTELLASKGYAVITETESGEDEETYVARDFEKTFFSDETNITFCTEFLKRAKRDPFTNEIGKTIIFCVSRKHACKITQVLNVLAEKHFPNKYNSDFAVQVTSDIPNAQQFSLSFCDEANNLNGRTKFLDDYRTSKTRVCVTVGMMTTGYDCQDILNVALMRPIFSPSDFIQIKGRGTRKYLFEHNDNGNYLAVTKDKFFLFDFFGNVEYFEKGHNYDEILKLPIVSKPTIEIREFDPKSIYNNIEIDPLKTIAEINVGTDGLRVDRELFAKFEQVVKSDKTAKEKHDNRLYDDLIAHIDTQIMNKPKEFFSWDKLGASLNLDRNVTKKEMLDKVFGLIKSFPNKLALIEQEFDKFVLTNKNDVNTENIQSFKKFFEAYLSNAEIRMIIDSGRTKQLFTNQVYSHEDLMQLGKENLQKVLDYIIYNVNLNVFAIQRGYQC